MGVKLEFELILKVKVDQPKNVFKHLLSEFGGSSLNV